MSTKIVYAAAQCVVRYNNLTVRLEPGHPWAADDPFVKARPDLFSDEPTAINRTSPPPVEQATAAPGERRTTKRG